MQQTILLTGGTGMIGSALAKLLVQKGYRVIILSRKIPKIQQQQGIRYALWDVDQQQADVQAIREADHIIHLAGAGVVDKKWSTAYKKEIIDSRVNSSKLLIDTLSTHANVVKSVISASAIGWYGADHENTDSGMGFNETDPVDNSFLGQTCRLWEESIEPVTALGKRLTKFRIGIVLSNDGGALPEFKKPVRFGIAAILGNGKQVVSWIHIQDLCRMFIHALENESIHDVYNAVAPTPVTNKTLTLGVAAGLRGKFFIPVHVPAFVLKLMLGNRSIEVLKSATVSCKKIRETDFVFLYPSIEAALQNLSALKDPN